MPQNIHDELLFSRPFNDCITGRHFSIPGKGYMGWVQAAAREGDIVATFYGTRMLFVLRREGHGYRLLSDCYLQGFMEGETAMMKDSEETDNRIKYMVDGNSSGTLKGIFRWCFSLTRCSSLSMPTSRSMISTPTASQQPQRVP